MPRPEQVEPRAGEGAPHGAQAALERLAGSVPSERPLPPTAMPAGVGTRTATPPAASLDLQGPDLNAGLDSVLFGPSGRPDEPLTAGVPFGPGPSFVPRPQEDDQTFLARVASELDSSPSATPEVKAFAARIQRGE